MLRGLYTAAAGMIAQQRKHDTVTNNIANLNTPGYKQVNAVSRSFPEVLISLVNDSDGQAAKPVGRLNTGVMVEERLLDFTQGDLHQTQRPEDLALVSNIQVYDEVDGVQIPISFDANGMGINQAGETVIQPQAFFTVLNADGQERYTRNGSLRLNDAGELVTAAGHQVMGQSGNPITLQLPLNSVHVNEQGLFINSANGVPLVDDDGEPIQLLISQIDHPHHLIREGHDVFRLDESAEDPARLVDNMAELSVYQGFIERSNVDAAQAAVDMMTAVRLYEANQRVIQFYDRSLDKAVNEIGRV